MKSTLAEKVTAAGLAVALLTVLTGMMLTAFTPEPEPVTASPILPAHLSAAQIYDPATPSKIYAEFE